MHPMGNRSYWGGGGVADQAWRRKRRSKGRTVKESTSLARASDDFCSLVFRPPQIDDRNLQRHILYVTGCCAKPRLPSQVD